MNNIATNKSYSWIIGTICVVLAIAILLLYGFDLSWNADKTWVGPIFLYYFLVTVGAVTGLIRGVREIRKQNKIYGIVGIMVSLLAMAASIIIAFWIEISIFARTT